MGAKFSGGGAAVFHDRTDTPGEIVTELVNASDGQGLHFDGAGYVNLTNAAGAEFGTSDFSLEFIIDQDGDNTNDNYIFYSHLSGNSRVYVYNDISLNVVKLSFINSSASTANYTFSYDMAADYGSPTHYVISADRSGNAVLYKNGNSVASVSIAASSTVDVGASNTTVGVIGSQSSGFAVVGTFYRFRTWNKSLSAAEVTATYENATVPFADQYGSQTNKITASVDQTWSAAQADTGNDTNDKATFNAAYDWTAFNNTDISVASNIYQFSTSGTHAGTYYSAGFTAGKSYRATVRTGTITGAADYKAFVWNGASYVEVGTLVASTTNVFEFTAPSGTTTYIYLFSSSATAGTIQLDASSVSNEIVEIGVVSDYDLAFANPTQSTMVQDRAGAADGTSSASGVTQVTPIEQVNTNKLSVGGTTPLVGIGLAAGSSPQEMLHIDGISPRIRLRDSDATGTPYSTIDASGGSVLISADVLDETASTEIGLATDGTTRLTIDSAGNVQVGGTVTTGASSTTLGVTDSTTARVIIKSTGTGGREYGLFTGLSGDVGVYDYTAAATRLSISSAGAVDIPGTLTVDGLSRSKAKSDTVGTPTFYLSTSMLREGADASFNIDTWDGAAFQNRLKIVGATGLATFSNGIAVTTGGVAFPATQSASADANTLDDYEEGIYVPTITCSSSGSYTTTTYTTLAYTKIGRVVHVQGYINVSAESSPSGTIRVSLPFTAATGLQHDSEYTAGNIHLRSHGGTLDNINAMVSANTAYFQLSQVAEDGSQAWLTEGDVDTAFSFYLGLTYIA